MYVQIAPKNISHTHGYRTSLCINFMAFYMAFLTIVYIILHTHHRKYALYPGYIFAPGSQKIYPPPHTIT